MEHSLLLAELHAHTTWSDGDLSLRALVDLYGGHGFDVLCVTDHTVRVGEGTRISVDVDNWSAYRDDVLEEADRARFLYDLLVLPGLELTDDHEDPLRSAHALAIGLPGFVSVEYGIRPALAAARRTGAALDRGASRDAQPTRAGERVASGTSMSSSPRWSTASSSSTARTSFPGSPTRGCRASRAVIFTDREHLDTWKTMLPCAKEAEAVVECLRSDARAYLAPFPLGVGLRAVASAAA